MPTKKAPTKVAKTKKTATPKKRTATSKTRVKKTATKKATLKKTPTKKASATKKPTQKRSGRVLVCAEGQSCFWTTDGQILKDLVSLSGALEEMKDEVFTHHVTKEKNDFADWVEHVLSDAECAAALRKSRKPHTARTTVVRHLKYYNV